jgi:aspartyl-tRNA(Asn)/glutamyl-tRNA(Gln) amidotransferase subunit A
MISRLPNIARAGELIRAGDLSLLELVEFCLAQIQQYDPAVRAWVVVDTDGARQQAARLEEELRKGHDRGLLHGIPIGIKDIIDVEGLPTKAGSPLRENHMAARDAPVVASLRERGAVIMGKTVTTEFAGFDPPATRNPWNENHTPGGSSSGAAAAVAAQMCMAALGTQTGGSITRPASYCGVAGLKPTHAVVDMNGIVPLSQGLDHVGPIAPAAGDLCLVFRALVDRSDDQLRVHQATGPPRFSRIEEYFMESADENVREVTRAALDRLQETSLDSCDQSLPPSFGQVHAMHRRIMATDAADYHRDKFLKSPESFGPNISSLIQEGLQLPAADYQAALDHQQRFHSDVESLFEGGRIAVTPATDTTAPARLNTTGDPRFQSPWSYAGLPTVNIPCGLDSQGMPCGLQLIGPRDSEERVLAAAIWCEQRLAWNNSPPMLS